MSDSEHRFTWPWYTNLPRNFKSSIPCRSVGFYLIKTKTDWQTMQLSLEQSTKTDRCAQGVDDRTALLVPWGPLACFLLILELYCLNVLVSGASLSISLELVLYKSSNEWTKEASFIVFSFNGKLTLVPYAPKIATVVTLLYSMHHDSRVKGEDRKPHVILQYNACNVEANYTCRRKCNRCLQHCSPCHLHYELSCDVLSFFHNSFVKFRI